jgi:hypothetical protein
MVPVPAAIGCRRHIIIQLDHLVRCDWDGSISPATYPEAIIVPLGPVRQLSWIVCRGVGCPPSFYCGSPLIVIGAEATVPTRGSRKSSARSTCSRESSLGVDFKELADARGTGVPPVSRAGTRCPCHVAQTRTVRGRSLVLYAGGPVQQIVLGEKSLDGCEDLQCFVATEASVLPTGDSEQLIGNAGFSQRFV